MTTVPDHIIEKAAKVAYLSGNCGSEEWAAAAWEDMGGSEPFEERARLETNMGAALSAVVDDIRAEVLDRMGAPYNCCKCCADDPVHDLDPDTHDIPCNTCQDPRVNTAKASVLREAANEIDLEMAFPIGECRGPEAAAEAWLRLRADELDGGTL